MYLPSHSFRLHEAEPHRYPGRSRQTHREREFLTLSRSRVEMGRLDAKDEQPYQPAGPNLPVPGEHDTQLQSVHLLIGRTGSALDK